MDDFKKFCEADDSLVIGRGHPTDDSDFYDRYSRGFYKDPSDPHRSRRVTKMEREQILNLASKGMNPQEIGFHVEVPIWVIDGILKRNKTGGRVDPNLSIANMQRSSEDEEAMNQRSQWDKSYIGDEEQERQLNNQLIKDMRRDLVKRYNKNPDSQRINPTHAQQAIDNLIVNHLKQFQNKTVMNSVRKVLSNVTKPFSSVWNDIKDILRSSREYSKPDYENYARYSHMNKPATNPYINQPQSWWQRLKNKISS